MVLAPFEVQALISAAKTESTQTLIRMLQHSQAQQTQAMEHMFARVPGTGAAARHHGSEGHRFCEEALDAKQLMNLLIETRYTDWAFQFNSSVGASSSLAHR